ncbi:MAG: hypothetical protein WCT44_01700 [Candidatus Paceibacterota bacterium]
MREIEPSKVIAPELGAEVISAEKSVRVAKIISELEGVKLNKNQKNAAAIIGGAERTFDSAFDQKNTQTAKLRGREILRVITERETKSPHLDSYLNRALVLAQENLTTESLAVLVDLTKAQIDSIQQREKGISLNTIRDITKRKGGKAALMLALEVSPHMDIKKQNCYEELGFLIQLIDDFEDREIDTKDGIATLANRLVQPQVLSEIMKQTHKVKKCLKPSTKLIN